MDTKTSLGRSDPVPRLGSPRRHDLGDPTGSRWNPAAGLWRRTRADDEKRLWK
jgi:hypothetical protein